MAIIGNNADTLLQGLSDFWRRFFQDIDEIQAVYEGTEILLGQVYLELLNDVLNTSVQDTPIFRKEYYKLITLREDAVLFLDGSNQVYAVQTPYNMTALPQLQNKIYNPTASLEQKLDYDINAGLLVFPTDPTNPPTQGFASRRVTIGVGGAFSAPSVADWTTIDIAKGDTLRLNPVNPLTGSNNPDGTLAFTIVQVASDRLVLSLSTPIPKYPAGLAPSGFSWCIERTMQDGTLKPGLPSNTAFEGQTTDLSTLTVNEVSYWAVDALVDDADLYNTFGYLVGRQQASSEVYRGFIRGLMQLYVFGPAIERMESALNVIAGLPLVRDDGEVFLAYDSGIRDHGSDGVIGGSVFHSASASFTADDVGSYLTIPTALNSANINTFRVLSVTDSIHVVLSTNVTLPSESGLTWTLSPTRYQTVTTDRQTYIYPVDVPMRSDLSFDNIGVLTFQAFETLTTAVTVTDYLRDPEWWHNIAIPPGIVSSTRNHIIDRLVSPQVFPNVIGEAGGFCIGDAGFYIGADEDGIVGGSQFHHRAAFILMDRFLKAHLFQVKLDPSIDLTGVLIADMQKMLAEVKPAHTAMYFTPITSFDDVIALAEATLSLVATVYVTPENFILIDNRWKIGDGWVIGQGFQYILSPGSDGDLGNGEYLTGVGDPYCPVVIGGESPMLQSQAGPDAYYVDRPLYVHTRPFP